MTKFVAMTDAMLGMTIPNILKGLTFAERYNFVLINKLDEPLTYIHANHAIGRWPLEENLPELSMFQSTLVSPDPKTGVLASCAEFRPSDFARGPGLAVSNNWATFTSKADMTKGARVGVAEVYSTSEGPEYAFQSMGPTIGDTVMAGYHFVGTVFKRGPTIVWAFLAARADGIVSFRDGHDGKVTHLDRNVDFTF